MATESQSTATLFTINGKSFAYTDKEGNNATIEVGETSDFAVANAMIAPAASDCYTDDEDIVRPEGDVTYYYIASVGGGGVIGANLPGDALTHSAPSMGSYGGLSRILKIPNPMLISSTASIPDTTSAPTTPSRPSPQSGISAKTPPRVPTISPRSSTAMRAVCSSAPPKIPRADR